MKKIFFAILAILVLVIIVLPLIYISLGKLKSPVDLISENITKQTFANQNYVPEQADPTDPDQKIPSAFDDELEVACEKTEINLKAEDISQYQVTGSSSKYIATSTDFAFTWTLPGSWEKPSDKKILNSSGFPLYITGGSATSSILTLGMYAKKNSDQKCNEYVKKTFNTMHDSNRFLSKYDWDKAGFSLREKGLITIRGIAYYWYGFEDMRKVENGYLVIFNSYKNGVEYGTSFMGYKKVNGSYRNITNSATQYMGQLIVK